MEITREQLINFLRSHPIISIAVSKNNKPMASIVLTATDEDFTKYFICSKNSYKAKALLENPQISWSVWEHQNMSIQADGLVEIVTEEEKSEIIDKVATTTAEIENFWPPILSITDEEYVIFRIKNKWLKAFNIKNLKITENTPPFTIFTGDKK